MEKIALGETMPIDVTKVEEVVGRDKFKVTFTDDDGDEGTIYLDVEMPLGPAEVKIMHKSQ